MKTSKKNFIVDIFAFICFVFLVSTGLILFYNLPKGSGHSNTIWNLERHEWGNIHFWIAVSFLLILALHFVLHWKWIVSLIKGRSLTNSRNRIALGLVGLFALIVIAIAPIITPAQNSKANELKETQSASQTLNNQLIRGSMTLYDLEQKTNVPISHFVEKLTLPQNVSKEIQLKELRNEYNFTMEDVRRVIDDYKP